MNVRQLENQSFLFAPPLPNLRKFDYDSEPISSCPCACRGTGCAQDGDYGHGATVFVVRLVGATVEPGVQHDSQGSGRDGELTAIEFLVSRPE